MAPLELPPASAFQVPATSANLGPGFDIFGLALRCYSRFRLNFHPPGSDYTLRDNNQKPLPIPADRNLIRTGYLFALERAGVSDKEAPSITAQVDSDLPIGSGFGSSASALVAGVAAANHLLRTNHHKGFDLDSELKLLNELEGHPDNVVPARVGGWVFSCIGPDGNMIHIRKTLPDDLGLALILPGFQISTDKSRTTLPDSYTTADVLHNMRGVLLWTEYLHSGDPRLLVEAIRSDRLHEPYRTASLPGYDQLLNSLLQLGCYGATISGSGPGILIYYPTAREEQLTGQMQQLVERLCKERNLNWKLLPCRADYGGLQPI